MTKIEVINQKPSKNWIFGKNGHFLTLFGQKNPQFWIFLRVPLLTHTSRHLGEDFKKFSAKTNDKIEVHLLYWRFESMVWHISVCWVLELSFFLFSLFYYSVTPLICYTFSRLSTNLTLHNTCFHILSLSHVKSYSQDLFI